MSLMAPSNRTPEQKFQIARGWAEARRSGLRQRQYAQECGISDRCLRAYLREYAPTVTPTEQLRQVIAETKAALSKLEARLDDLDADPEDLPAGEPVVVDPTADRQAEKIAAIDRHPRMPTSEPVAPAVAAAEVPVEIQEPRRATIDPELNELLDDAKATLLARLAADNTPVAELVLEPMTEVATDTVVISTTGMPLGSGEDPTTRLRTWSWDD